MDVSDGIRGLNIQWCDGSQLLPRALRFFGVSRVITIHPPVRPLPLIERSGSVSTYDVEYPIARASLVDLLFTRYLPTDEIHQRLRQEDFDLENNLLLPAGAARPD